MDKTFALGQLILASIMLACVVIGVPANIIVGNITSIGGILFSLGIVYMVWLIVRESWKEYSRDICNGWGGGFPPDGTRCTTGYYSIGWKA